MYVLELDSFMFGYHEPPSFGPVKKIIRGIVLPDSPPV